MVKTPKMRHSRPGRQPVTIDLEPGAVSRIPDADEAVTASGDEDMTDGRNPDEKPIPQEAAVEPEEAAQPAGHDFDAAPPNTAGIRQETRRDEPARAPVRATRDGFSRVAAGIIGAVVALAGAGMLQYAGIFGAPEATGVDTATRAEFDGLKQQVAELRQAPAVGELGPRVDDLASALEAVKADLAALQQTVTSGTDAAGLSALDGRIKAVEAALANAAKSGAAGQPVDLTALSDRIAAVEGAVKAATGTVTAGAGRIATLEQSVAALTTKVDSQAAQPKVALAIATAALRSALDRGAPFTAELETLAAISPGSPEITALRPFAEKGLPTREALVAETETAAVAMIAAANPVADDAGFFDRLLQSAESLVTVRPIGAVEGTSVPAIVARMEVAVKSGNLDAALAEFDSLPEPAKAAGRDFGDRLKARRDAELLVDQAIAAAMKA